MITLGYAILGLLARQPLSGYDIVQQMKRPIGFFWHAQVSQIYPELARLQKLGYITHEVIAQQDRPDKKLHSITTAGREALREWVTTPQQAAHDRDEFLLKIFSLWLAAPHEVIVMVREQERHHRAQLAEYEARTAGLLEWQGDNLLRLDNPLFADYATLQRGIGYERERADWCAWLIAQIERLSST